MELHRRKSKQRERIYELVRVSKDHPTAQAIYDRLKPEIPTLSLGNVYRNISILLEEGRLQSGEFGSGNVRFDAVTRPHYHFVCERCGAVEDIPIPFRDDVTAAAQEMSPHRISGHTIRFYGVCAACLEKERAISKKRR